MGPDPATNGSLSSQLAGMSKCGAPLQFWGCCPVTQLELEHHQQNISLALTSLGPQPWRKDQTRGTLPPQPHNGRALSGLRNPTVLRLPLDTEFSMA